MKSICIAVYDDDKIIVTSERKLLKDMTRPERRAWILKQLEELLNEGAFDDEETI
jgi:nickel-dependent lactate racemase